MVRGHTVAPERTVPPATAQVAMAAAAMGLAAMVALAMAAATEGGVTGPWAVCAAGCTAVVVVMEPEWGV